MTEYLLLAVAAFRAGRSLFWRSNVIEMLSGAVATAVQLKAQNVVGRSLVTSNGVALFHSLPLEFLELQVDHRRGVIVCEEVGMEKVGSQAHSLRHFPPRKLPLDPAAAGFFRCFRGLCGVG